MRLLGRQPWRRATSVTTPPGSRLSAAICDFTSSGQRLRPAPAYTSIRGDNGRLMSSEWSSIVGTLAEDDSSGGAPETPHKQSDGSLRYAYGRRHILRQHRNFPFADCHAGPHARSSTRKTPPLVKGLAELRDVASASLGFPRDVGNESVNGRLWLPLIAIAEAAFDSEHHRSHGAHFIAGDQAVRKEHS